MALVDLAKMSGKELAKHAITGGSVTAGAVLAYELMEIAKSDPKLAIETVGRWGPMFVIVVLIIFVVNSNFGQMIQLSRDNVAAQQRMADAMQSIALKDDRQAEKIETLTSYSALQSEKVLRHLDDQKLRMDRHEYWLAQIGEMVKVRIPGVSVPPTEVVEKARSASA